MCRVYTSLGECTLVWYFIHQGFTKLSQGYGREAEKQLDSTGEVLGKQTHCMCVHVCMCVYVYVCDMRECFFFPLSTYSCSKFRGCQSSRSGSMTTAISTPSSEEGKLLVMCCCCCCCCCLLLLCQAPYTASLFILGSQE